MKIEQEVMALRARVAGLEVIVQPVNQRIDEVTAKLRDSQARVAELEAGMLDLANRVMPKMRSQVAELEAENNRLISALRMAISEVDDLETETANYKGRVAALFSENEKLKARVAELEAALQPRRAG